VARAENATPQPVAVRADQVITERVAAWSPVAAKRGVQLAPLRPVTALGGGGYLAQIPDNLIANAVDSGAPGTHISAGVTIIQQKARVVAEDGPGVSPAEMNRSFRRFAASGTGGSGLGLAIVHRLATSSGGSVALSQTPGGGLTVTVDVPLAERAGRPGARPASPPG